MFERKGYLAIEREHLLIDEDTLLEKILEAGAEDLVTSDEVFEIYTEAEDFTTVRDFLEQEFTLAQAELTMLPQTTVSLNEAQQNQFDQLIEKLEDDDDVSEVYTSIDNS